MLFRSYQKTYQQFSDIGGTQTEQVYFKANGEAYFRGNVGVGTTSPSHKLTIGSSTDADLFFISSTASANNTSLRFGISGNDSIIHASGGSSGNLAFYTYGSERARIDNSGRLLVGTSSASLSNKFALQGDTSSANNGGYMRLQTGNSIVSGTSLGSIGFGDAVNNGALIEAKGEVSWSPFTKGSRIEFSTTADGASSPTERMRITQNGTVFVHKTTSGSGVDGLELVKLAGGTQIQNTVSNNGTRGIVQNMRYGAGTQYAMGIVFNGTEVGTISCTSTATAYNTSSDYRLKENVVPLTGAIDRLNDLQVHRFNFIADPDTTVDGFLAHEAQAVVPECVTGTKDEVDDEGNPVYQGIDQSKLVPLLTAALQEALQKIETQAGVITALDARLKVLEGN